MALGASNIETRVLALERRINRIRKNADDLYLWRVPGVEQNLGMLWALGPRRCVTTITGTIVGGLNTPMPSTTLQITGHVTGKDYGTYSVPTGTYSLSLVIDPLDTSIDLYPFGPSSPRFDGASPLANNKAITTPCGSNDLGIAYPPAAPGYGYLLASFSGSFACQYPVGGLNWTDSLIGSGTTTITGFGTSGISAVGSWISDCQLGDSYASVSCVARTGVPLMFGLGLNGSAYINFNTGSLFSSCPLNGSCPGDGLGNAIYPATAITSKTDPGVDLTTRFDCTWAVNDQIWHNGASHTIRFYEPSP